MVQTLRVDTGHCNNHLLYRNVWAQVTWWGANRGNKHWCAHLPECHVWGAMDWALWTSPLATPISRFIEPRLLFMGTSEESCLCDSTWLGWGSRCSNIRSCCTCAWNTWYLWTCTPIAPPTLSSIYRYWWTQFWAVLVNITLVNDAFNKHFVFPFVSYFLCLCLTASLAPIHSYTINDCYNVLYLPLKFVPWIWDHPVFTKKNQERTFKKLTE